jgi:deazaflavin-dependent oxidoreductase (nitroreductase family)
VRLAIRLPIALYRLGLGIAIGAAPVMILTTRGRRTGLPRHTPLEYRQHGSKFYLVSVWGDRAQWVQNLLADPNVTIQFGHRTYAARGHVVEDAGELHRVAHLYRRQAPYIYNTLLARLINEPSINPREAMANSDSLAIIRLDRLQDTAPRVPPLRPDLAWVLPAVTMLMTVTLGLLVAARTRRS